MDSQYPHDMELKVPKKFKVKFSKDNGERRQIVKKWNDQLLLLENIKKSRQKVVSFGSSASSDNIDSPSTVTLV